MRRLVWTATVALMVSGLPAGAQAPDGYRPVVFVHGLGASAADVGAGRPPAWGDLMGGIAERFPRPGVCQDDAQPGRPWDGSPCVFRYVEDIAEATEGGAARRGPNDSQSSVRENAAKLAHEVAQVAQRSGTRVILIGYSMGGAIIRTYLSLHPDEAERDTEAVVLVNAVTQGSWGFSLISEVVGRASGPMSARTMELFRTLAAGAASVDLTRPAPNELRPRSPLYQEITATDPPPTISYYTFWGDVRVTIGRRLLAYDLPDFELPSLGDLGLLPGDPDPSAMPELGGQRFTPTDLADGHEAWDIPHTAQIHLDAEILSTLIERCGRPSQGGSEGCRDLIADHFAVPNAHTAVPLTLSRISVDVPDAGTMPLLDAILLAIDRNQP